MKIKMFIGIMCIALMTLSCSNDVDTEKKVTVLSDSTFMDNGNILVKVKSGDTLIMKEIRLDNEVKLQKKYDSTLILASYFMGLKNGPEFQKVNNKIKYFLFWKKDTLLYKCSYDTTGKIITSEGDLFIYSKNTGPDINKGDTLWVNSFFALPPNVFIKVCFYESFSKTEFCNDLKTVKDVYPVSTFHLPDKLGTNFIDYFFFAINENDTIGKYKMSIDINVR